MKAKARFKTGGSTPKSLLLTGFVIGLLFLGTLACSEKPGRDIKIFHGAQ